MPSSRPSASAPVNLISSAARNPTNTSGALWMRPLTAGPCPPGNRRSCMQEHPILIKQDVFEHFTLPLHVDIRMCVKDDLADLEWFGLFTEHREIFLREFARQERNENIMLIAEANTLPIGQVWIDL